MTTNVAEANIIEILRGRQQSERLSDAAMASKLGISRSYWTLLRRGQKLHFGLGLIEGIARAYPDLSAETLVFLRREVTIRNTSAANGTQS